MALEDNKRIVAAFLAGFEKSGLGTGVATPEVGAMLDLMSDDVRWWMAGSQAGSAFRTKEQFRTAVAQLHQIAAGKFVIETVGVTAEGDRVAVEARSSLRLKNGSTYGNVYHFLFEVRDDKIVALREYLDTAALQALRG